MQRILKDQSIIGPSAKFNGEIAEFSENSQYGLFMSQNLAHPLLAIKLSNGEWAIYEWIRSSALAGLLLAPDLLGNPDEIAKGELARFSALNLINGMIEKAEQESEEEELLENEFSRIFFERSAQFWIDYKMQALDSLPGKEQ